MLLDEYIGSKSALDDGKDPGPGYCLYKFPDKESLKLHVIDTCGECHWGRWHEPMLANERICKKTNPNPLKDFTFDKDEFGCINFKQKEI